MNDATIQAFRSIAATMYPEPRGWQWIGAHMSQRMFDITEQRAKDYAAKFGGVATQMTIDDAAAGVERRRIANEMIDDHDGDPIITG